MKNSIYNLEFAVRDYECDLTGIVNNANYQHYLEHARHEFLKQRGVDFAAWFQRGISLVVVRIEMDFLFPLRSGDKFMVTLDSRRISRLRLGFDQDIYRLPDEKPILKSVLIASAINERGRPEVPPELFALLLGK
jgi:acyl-CoA thioester hydrolase